MSDKYDIHHGVVKHEGSDVLVSVLSLTIKHKFRIDIQGDDDPRLRDKKQEHNALMYEAMLSMIPRRLMREYLED
jgi:hypothetical protein